MRIGIASLGRVAEDTGGRNYILHFLAELERLQTGHTFVLFFSEGEAEALGIQPSHDREIVTVRGSRATPLHKVFGEQILLARAVKRAGVDVLYCPGNFVPLFSRVPRVVNIRATAHFYGKRYGITGWRRVIRTLLMPATARKAKAIITPSEDIKRDAVRFCNVPAGKITVIPHGVDTRVFSPELRGTSAASDVLDRFGLHERQYLLYVSALWEYKNHARLIEAHSEIVKRYPALKLVIAGHGTGTDPRHIAKLHSLPAALGIPEIVVFIGSQPQSVLRYLYASATAFVFPSLYESFGNPIFEAWASGIPVIASNVHSFPEIVAEAGVLFDPYDPHSITEAIHSVLEDTLLQKRLVAAGTERVKKFTWEACVTRTLSLIESVSHSNRSGL